MRIEGEWNKVITLKPTSDKVVILWYTGSFIQPIIFQDEMIVIDTLNMPTIKKKVRKLEAQGDTESRRLWRHLTKALWNNDLESATASKHEVSIDKKS